MYTFIQQGCIELIKSDITDIYNVIIKYLFQVNVFFLLHNINVCVCVCVHVGGGGGYNCFHKHIKQICLLFSALIIIINVSNQHIIIISEGSCDTEDWSNAAENTALPSQEKITF